jgi:ATP-dependent Clp protease ATP-binding subunit ClpA
MLNPGSFCHPCCPPITLEASAREGFDPQFGARPLKRTVQDLVLDPLATKLLVGEFKPGDRIKAVARNGALEFEKK